MQRDLIECAQGDVKVRLNPVAVYDAQKIEHLQGDCIDEQDIEITSYEFNADWLKDCVSDEIVEEKLVSHLLKSNCLITNQPDWGTLHIHYVGKKSIRKNYCVTLYRSVSIMNSTNNVSNVFLRFNALRKTRKTHRLRTLYPSWRIRH